MKFLANTTLQALLLIVVLGSYACSLSKDVMMLSRLKQKQAIMAHAKSDLIYDQPAGVDVYGKKIVPSSLSKKRNIVFFLRNENLQKDLDFWSHVGMLLDSHREIGLIGYCDGWQCADSIRKMHPLGFPVLAFGEATDIEAVVDADGDNKAILKDVGSHLQSTILWRSAESSPQKAVQEAIR